MNFASSLLRAVAVPALLFGCLLAASAQEYRTGVGNACHQDRGKVVHDGGSKGVTGTVFNVTQLRPNTNHNAAFRQGRRVSILQWNTFKARTPRGWVVGGKRGTPWWKKPFKSNK